MTLAPLFIVSGPSGSGKSTLIREVIARSRWPLRQAISATTRDPRPGEVNGVNYHFWTLPKFQEELARGAFLEYATVHGKHLYGTPRSEVDGYREKGVGVILDIDVQGAAQVRTLFPDHISIFVRLSAPAVYEERLRQRGSETPESIARRMATAIDELARIGEYQYVIENDILDQAIERFLTLIESCQQNQSSGENQTGV